MGPLGGLCVAYDTESWQMGGSAAGLFLGLDGLGRQPGPAAATERRKCEHLLDLVRIRVTLC